MSDRPPLSEDHHHLAIVEERPRPRGHRRHLEPLQVPAPKEHSLPAVRRIQRHRLLADETQMRGSHPDLLDDRPGLNVHDGKRLSWPRAHPQSGPRPSRAIASGPTEPSGNEQIDDPGRVRQRRPERAREVVSSHPFSARSSLPSRTSPRSPRSAATDPECTFHARPRHLRAAAGEAHDHLRASPTAASSLPYPPALSPKSGSSTRETSKAAMAGSNQAQPGRAVRARRAWAPTRAVPRTWASSHSLRNAPRGSSRSTRRTKSGMPLVERRDRGGVREEQLAPVRARAERRQRGLEVGEHALDRVLVALPGEVDARPCPARTAGSSRAGRPRSCGSRTPAAAARIVPASARTRPDRGDGVPARQQVLRLDLVAGARREAHAEVRQPVRPGPGPAELRRAVRPGPCRGSGAGRPSRRGAPNRSARSCSGSSVTRLLTHTWSTRLAPAREDADAVAARDDLVEVLEQRVPARAPRTRAAGPRRRARRRA